MSHVIYVGVLCIALVLAFLRETSADDSIRRETRKENKLLLKDIFGGRTKRQLQELCQQSAEGCIIQNFSEEMARKKRKKRKKKRKNRNKEKNNKRRKMSKLEETNSEPIETCPYLDPPTDDEDEDDDSECPQAQQTVND